MTVSRNSRLAPLAVAMAAIACGLACAKPRAPENPGILLEPRPSGLSAWVPGDADRSAARVAAAALASRNDEMTLALEELARTAPSENDRLAPLAQDMVNSTLDDPDLYRAASQKLLDDHHVDSVLKSRLQEAIDDDPLKLAGKRSRDRYTILWARTFNAVSAPVGRALLSGFTTAPLEIANTTAHYLASFYGQDPLSMQGRQALAHRKQFLVHHPDAASIARAVANDEEKLRRTRRNGALRSGRTALKKNRPRLALFHAERALQLVPGDRRALELLEQSEAQIRTQRSYRELSLEATPDSLPELFDPVAQRLMLELLVSQGDPSEEIRKLIERPATDPTHEIGRYLLASELNQDMSEDAGWRQLERLTAGPGSDSVMARYSRTLLANPDQNPHGAFRARLSNGNKKRLAWLFLDNFAFGTRYPRMPKIPAYIVDSLTIMQTVISSPVRWIFAPWKPGPQFHRPAALSAYQYLALYPGGIHSQEMLGWLFKYEKARKNWEGALRLADFRNDFPLEDRNELVEKAASQRLVHAEWAPRRDQRNSILRNVVVEFPDAYAGTRAGILAREQLKRHSAQRIRLTKGFLLENPRVAGPQGLGVSRHLLDDDVRNGELHPEGVTMLGGRRLEFALVAETGDPEDAPERRRKEVSGERLAQTVALLEETTLTNSRIDREDLLPADARRDYFLERARLGLTESPDDRSTAQSTYVYKSLRERFGMVRGRDSILPFDLVIQGRLDDLSLGAFPRWRYPRTTPDAFLYR